MEGILSPYDYQVPSNSFTAQLSEAYLPQTSLAKRHYTNILLNPLH